MELSNLPEKEFKVMIMKMCTGLEIRVHGLREGFNKETENIKNESEMKNTVNKMKNTLNQTNSRLGDAEWIRDLEAKKWKAPKLNSRKKGV